MIKPRRILLTGAAGALGRQLRGFLRERCDHLRITDREPLAAEAGNEEAVACDLGDYDAVMALASDVDAIVHMGGIGRESTFADILHGNVTGVYHIFEAARKNGVKRVVWPSSVHAVGYHKRTSVLEPDCLTRPDSLYGVSKVYGEALAQYYFDKFGLQTVSIRIGSCFPKPTDWRMLSTWLSYDDLRHLIERCLTVPKVDHTIVFGVSDNTESFWDNSKVSYLGYRPKDNAEAYRDEIETNVPRPEPADLAIAHQGGSFVAKGHFEDE